MFGFRKKKTETRDSAEDIVEQVTRSNKISVEKRACAACQQKLGSGIHRMLLVKDDAGTPFQLLYHGNDSCFNLDLIEEQMKLRGYTIDSKGHSFSSSSMEKFPDEARKILFGEDK